MSDYGESWDEMMERAIPIGDLGDGLNINDYFEWYTDEVETAWDAAPTWDMSEGQLDHFIEMLEGMAEELTEDEWADMLEWIDADFWEWYGENYGEN